MSSQNKIDSSLTWLKAKNTKYLASEDLPDGKDVVLEISFVGTEIISNPKVKDSIPEEGLVVSFVKTAENKGWIKPFICNVTNARAIMKMTGKHAVEHALGRKIKIGVDSNVTFGKKTVNGLRVRANITSDQLECGLSEDQQIKITDLITQSKGIITLDTIINAYKVKHLSNIPSIHFDKIYKGIESRISQIAEKQKDLI